MKRIVMVTLVVTLAVAGCGRIRDSRLNPFNWFGGSRSEPREQVSALEAGMVRKADPRQMVAQVTALAIDRTPNGAIVQAAGLPPTQGYWDAALVADSDPVDGVLTYRLVVAQPKTPRPASTPQSREVTAAVFLSNAKLAEISKIVVQGVQNSRVSSR